MSSEENNPWREAAERGFEAEGDGVDRRDEPKRRSALGCVLWGCLIAVLVAIVLAIAAAVGGYYFLKGQLSQYTAEEPIDLPVVELEEERIAELEQRVEGFAGQIDADPGKDEGAPDEAEEAAESDELVLTADEINALIASNKDLRGRVFVRIEDGLVSGDVSLPTDALPLGGGRFFNATATFDVSLTGGDLTVRLVDASVKGQPLPGAFLSAIAAENLAKDFRKDPEVAKVLNRIGSLRVEEDRIVLAKRADSDVAAEPTTDPADAEPALIGVE